MSRKMLILAVVLGCIAGGILLMIINKRGKGVNKFYRNEIFQTCIHLDCQTKEERPWVKFEILDEIGNLDFILEKRLNNKERFCKIIELGDTLVKKKNSYKSTVLKTNGDTTYFNFHY